jgi:hypothetical protein
VAQALECLLLQAQSPELKPKFHPPKKKNKKGETKKKKEDERLENSIGLLFLDQLKPPVSLHLLTQ